MTDTYPLPRHAATIWVANGALQLAIPGTDGRAGHILTFPQEGRGFTALVQVLEERQRQPDSTIGQRGAPTSAEAKHKIYHQKALSPRCVFCDEIRREREYEAAARQQLRAKSLAKRPQPQLKTKKLAEDLGL